MSRGEGGLMSYDAIVVGARCAGSPTAMLLARKGYRVLLVDRATFPSDTVSTHIVHPMGVAALARWGVLGRLEATGCPPIHTYAFDFGPFTISGAPGTADSPVAYCPRRTVLDKILVDAAAAAGAEVREGFVVEEVLFEAGRVAGIKGRARAGATVSEHGRIVIVEVDERVMQAAEARPRIEHDIGEAILPDQRGNDVRLVAERSVERFDGAVMHEMGLPEDTG